MGMGVGEAMLISAATGAGTSAVMGGDPLKGALLGAATGGIGHGIAGATAAGGANVGVQATTTGAEQMVAQTAADQATQQAAQQAAQQATFGANPDMIAKVTTPPLALPAPAVNPDMIAGVSDLQGMQNLAGYTPDPTELTKAAQVAENSMFPKIAEMSKSGYFYPGLGVAGSVIGSRYNMNLPDEEEYKGSLSQFRYDPGIYRPRRAASGGLMDTMPAQRMAGGGLGSYSDGGQTLKGPGDGMSDSIPASIGGSQPARLADGEFVVPADVVSGLGNGSTDAGARQLYAMMDKIRDARTGRTRQAPEINPNKMMPA